MAHRTGLIEDNSMSLAANEPPAGPTLARRRPEGRSRFDIYRTEVVHLTSTLFGGGDWHWCLTAQSGEVVADCGGYRNRRDCLAAVEALRAEAGSARLPEGPAFHARLAVKDRENILDRRPD